MTDRTNLLFTHKLIKAFADSMVKAFVPLIILKNTSSLLLVMIYLNSYYIMCGILNLVLKKFLQKYGVVAIVLHIIPIIALQFLLSALAINWWICLLIALLASFGQVLYSVPLNLLFSFSDKNVNVAKFQIATNVGKLIFILLSGYVLGSQFKNSILLLSIIGGVLYIASVIPIMYGYRLLKNSYCEISKKHPQIEKKSYIKFNIFHMCFSIFQSVLDVVVPLYLFVNNLAFQTIAIVMALIEVCKICSNLLAKFICSKNKQFISCCISIVVFLVGCVLMLFVKIPVVLFISSCVISISFPLIFVPMFSIFCKRIKADNYQFDGMSYRDVYILPSKCIMFSWFFVLPYFYVQFIVGMVASVTMGFFCKKICDDNVKLDNPTQAENTIQVESE